MLSGWMGVSPKLRIEVTFLMTFSSVNPMKVGDGHNMKAVEQAGECLFSDTKVSQMRGGRRVYCSSQNRNKLKQAHLTRMLTVRM